MDQQDSIEWELFRQQQGDATAWFKRLSRDRAHLEHLSSSALKAFFSIGAAWDLSTEEKRTLLGGINRAPYQT